MLLSSTKACSPSEPGQGLPFDRAEAMPRGEFKVDNALHERHSVARIIRPFLPGFPSELIEPLPDDRHVEAGVAEGDINFSAAFDVLHPSLFIVDRFTGWGNDDSIEVRIVPVAGWRRLPVVGRDLLDQISYEASIGAVV